MRFFVHIWRKSVRQYPFTAHLTPDTWNDYNFVTLHHLVVVDARGRAHQIGPVKIGEFGQLPDRELTQVPSRFEALPERFFSLGQSDSFYSNLQALGSELNEVILSALRDVAYDQQLYERAVNEQVTRHSLLRDVSSVTVEGQFRRLARGGSRLSRYQFAYQLPGSEQPAGVGPPPVTLAFEVLPESNPPTNIHVLIGRNGVGKTHLLQGMTRALIGEETNETGSFLRQDVRSKKRLLFANVVSVTFSAFDPFSPLPKSEVEAASIRYAYVGLKQPAAADGSAALKSYQDLQQEFANSLWACYRRGRLDQLRRAVTVLATDPVFRDNGIYELLVQTSAEARAAPAATDGPPRRPPTGRPRTLGPAGGLAGLARATKSCC